jgi:hypothetical protein
MKTQHVLMSVPANSWVAGQVVVFDWFDGPRQGVARMAKPECEFAFELLAERLNPDGLDDRLFRVSELPAGSVTRILDTIHSLGSPVNVVWVPVWKFGSEEERLQADQEIDRILSQQRGTGLVVYSRDMITFLGCWEDDQVQGEVQDWTEPKGEGR